MLPVCIALCIWNTVRADIKYFEISVKILVTRKATLRINIFPNVIKENI